MLKLCIGCYFACVADPQHVERIRKGVAAWNEWRAGSQAQGLVLTRANLDKAKLPKVDFHDSDLYGANLRESNLGEANFADSNLKTANFQEAYLYRAILSRADMRDSNLRNAILSEAKLNKARLVGAKLRNAELRKTDLSGAQLSGVDLTRVDLRGANFSDASLDEVNFTEAKLADTNFSGALLLETTFVNTNLNHVTGLDSCIHRGPSTIDFRTLARSGNLPVNFLRGCGIPEPLITYLPSLLSEPIHFYSCFISYSTVDQEFADRLYSDLQGSGVRCWFAPHDMRGGKKLHEQIEQAIRVYDRLLLILSDASMQSEWVKTEIAHARQQEVRNGRRVLFPISIVPFSKIREWTWFDADTGKDSAREIREYFVPDFTLWKNHDKYKDAFTSLLKSLEGADAAENVEPAT